MRPLESPVVGPEDAAPENPTARHCWEPGGPVSHGPWDSGSVPVAATTATRHAVEVGIELVGARFCTDPRFLADVALSVADGGVPDTVILASTTGVQLSVCVLAEPVGEQRWAGSLATDTAAALRASLVDPADPAVGARGTVALHTGPFGTELHVRDAAGVLQLVKIGADGPRWTALVTCAGHPVTAADRDAAHRLLSTMTVFRGSAALPPDAPLSMQLLAQEED